MAARRKLQPRYNGSFAVKKAFLDVAYELALPAHFKIHPVIHISHLKASADESLEFLVRPEYQPPPPPVILGDDEDEEELFHIEAFRNHRYKGRGRKLQISFLVKWVGYGEHENKWISEKSMRVDMKDELMDELIDDYVVNTGAKLS